MFGSAISGTMGMAGQIASAKMTNDASRDMQNASIMYSALSAKKRHQWEVEDLKKAGLNPILSANGGSSAPGVGAPSGAKVDLAASALAMAQGLENLKLTKQNARVQKHKADIAEPKARMAQEAVNAYDGGKKGASSLGRSLGEKVYDVSEKHIGVGTLPVSQNSAKSAQNQWNMIRMHSPVYGNGK